VAIFGGTFRCSIDLIGEVNEVIVKVPGIQAMDLPNLLKKVVVNENEQKKIKRCGMDSMTIFPYPNGRINMTGTNLLP